MCRHKFIGATGAVTKSMMSLVYIIFPLLFGFASSRMRFVSLGNWGTNSNQQKTNAETLKKVVADEHITFFVSPGYNFRKGVNSPNDTLWKRAFEDVYKSADNSMGLLFFTVMGSGDWLGDYSSEIAPSVISNYKTETTPEASENVFPKWTIPNYWYHYFTHFTTKGKTLLGGHKDIGVGLVFIDTWVLSQSFPFKEVHNKAWEELQTTLEIAPKIVEYIVVVGDKPIYSSGASGGDKFLEANLLPLLKKANVDIYLAGHDYDLEVIKTDDITHITCGTGGSSGKSPFGKNENSLFFSEKLGFCLHELSDEGITTKFIDGTDGATLYTHEQAIKNRKELSRGNEIKYLAMLPPVVLTDIPSHTVIKNDDPFVKIVGSLGLVLAFGFLSLAFVTKKHVY